MMQHKFVEFMPSELSEGTLYISMEYNTVKHKCCCGCGEDVVTPLNPTDWKLIYDGETISLSPSVGNWNLPCRSHYFIKHSKIQWCGSWSENQVKEGKEQDQLNKEKHFSSASKPNKQNIFNNLWKKFKFW
jgi:hypothetical protein